MVLLSGGLDSATALAVARSEGYACYALSFRYGQRHAVELEAARRVASSLGVVRHAIQDIDLRAWGGSALTDDIDVPLAGESDAESIPVTYVPARNIIFLSFAVAWAEVLGTRDVFIGVNALDYSGYPDCRPEFIRAYEAMAAVGTKAGIEGFGPRIHTPLIDLSKKAIIAMGTQLGVDYALTLSCYNPDPDGVPCGHCDSCRIRSKGFAAAGLGDPALA